MSQTAITTNNSIESIPLLPAVHQFAYEQENILLSQVKTNRYAAISETLNGLLVYTLVTGKNQLLNSRQRISEFYSVLTRVLLETGNSYEILTEFHDIYEQLQPITLSYDQLCERTEQLAAFFLQTIQRQHALTAGENAVSQAKGYIARHYASKITLVETAAYVHLNPAYFSSVFKQLTGTSFKEYVNRVRIAKSIQLLKNSSYDIIDIAIATGFEDQSYFTKIFKKYTGSTPRQLRLQKKKP